MVDKKLSEFSAVQVSDVSDLVVLYLDENLSPKNGRLSFNSFVSMLALLSGNNTFTGTNTFSGDTVFSGNTTFNNPINGNISGNSATATNATNDASGNNIGTTYATKTELNGKVDLNAANLSTAGKSLISGLCMPSDTYEDLTLGASGSTYTAPANGYYAFSKYSTAINQYYGLINTNNNIRCEGRSVNISVLCGVFVPVKKNDVVQVGYGLGGETEVFRFIYAEGEV